MKYLLILAFLVSGCAKEYAMSNGVPVDASIFVNQLNSDLAKIGYEPIPNNIQYFQYNDIDESVHGLCSYGNGEYKISINFDPNDITVRDYLVFVHEIGHCVYGKGHDDSSPNIMTSNVSSDVWVSFKYSESERLALIKQMIEN